MKTKKVKKPKKEKSSAQPPTLGVNVSETIKSKDKTG